MQSPLSSCLPVGHPTMQNHIATYRNPPELTPALSAILQYRTISLPTQYLGLPLTIKKSPKMAYIPMLTAVQQRYEGYKGKTPINGEANNSDDSVLNAIPLHHMQALLLPKWVTNRIRNITRRFLWTGTKDTFSGGHCLLTWPKVTLPKINGGLNIMDIELQNKTLLLKWLWTADSDDQCLWTHTLNSLNSVGITMDVLKHTNTALDISYTSFFLRDLTSLLPMYDITVTYSADGTPHSR
jgi:hypothetical protein